MAEQPIKSFARGDRQEALQGIYSLQYSVKKQTNIETNLA